MSSCQTRSITSWTASAASSSDNPIRRAKPYRSSPRRAWSERTRRSISASSPATAAGAVLDDPSLIINALCLLSTPQRRGSRAIRLGARDSLQCERDIVAVADVAGGRGRGAGQTVGLHGARSVRASWTCVPRTTSHNYTRLHRTAHRPVALQVAARLTHSSVWSSNIDVQQEPGPRLCGPGEHAEREVVQGQAVAFRSARFANVAPEPVSYTHLTLPTN